MHHLPCLIFCFILIGCGTTSKVNLSSEPLIDETSFSFIDARPTQQKHSINNQEAHGKNYYFGDDNLNPSGPALVKATFQKELNSALTGKTLTLTDFDVHVYEPIASIDSDTFDTAVASTPGGYAVAPLAELLILAIEGMKSEKNVTVQIAGKLNEHSFSTNTSENFKGRVTEKNIKDTVKKALEDVISQIESIVATK